MLCRPISHGQLRRRLHAGYAKRVFYFEIVECLRKLAIVCVPVFFDAGSDEQLLFALVVTFCTSSAYSTIVPYSESTAHYLAIVAQGIIFFNLISSLAEPMGAFMDTVLTTLLAGFTAVAFVDTVLTTLLEGSKAASFLLSCCSTSCQVPRHATVGPTRSRTSPNASLQAVQETPTWE